MEKMSESCGNCRVLLRINEELDNNCKRMLAQQAEVYLRAIHKRYVEIAALHDLLQSEGQASG